GGEAKNLATGAINGGGGSPATASTGNNYTDNPTMGQRTPAQIAAGTGYTGASAYMNTGGTGNPGISSGTSVQGGPPMASTGNINLGGQGNNGNMGSTDATLGSTLVGAIPGVVSAGATTAGALAGSNAIQNADKNAITTQQTNLGNISNIWQPQQSLGVGADTSLGSALGTNGQPANYSGFENMPGYQFAVQQGTQAINRQAAAMGSAYTPNTSAAVGQYVTGTAMIDYNTYINQLMGAAGLGSTANTGIANPTYQTGANISTLQQNQGYANASGISGTTKGIAGAFGQNGAGTSLVNYLGSKLGGGGGNTPAGNAPAGNAPAGGAPYTGGVGSGPNGGVDPSTGIPYDIQNPNYGSSPPGSVGYDPSNPMGIPGMSTPGYNPNWNSVTDTSNIGNISDVGGGGGPLLDTSGGGGSFDFTDPSTWSDRRLKTNIKNLG